MTPRGLVVSKFAKTLLPSSLVLDGDIKDEKKIVELLQSFVRANKLSYVKVSLPEEKVYLFQTDIPNTEVRAVTQHVEFKLEENVPLSASDAIFYFDILPKAVTGNVLRASVSVAPKNYVEKLSAMLRGINLTPMAFEVAPKSIAKAVIPKYSDETYLIVHVMNRKTGIYGISGGVVCFSSTVTWGSRANRGDGKLAGLDVSPVLKEIHRVCAYWTTRPDTHSAIAEVIIMGNDAVEVLKAFSAHSSDGLPSVSVGDTWRNVFDVNKYIPPISRDESLEYAVAAGLALPS